MTQICVIVDFQRVGPRRLRLLRKAMSPDLGESPSPPPIPHPRLLELVEQRKLRKKVEHAVSVLTVVLDELEADPEAEPWLGAPEQAEPMPWTREPMQLPGRDQRRWSAGTNDEREEEDEHGGDILDGGDDDRVDDEPSLSAALNHHDQRHWAKGDSHEIEHLGTEEDVHA